MATNESLQLPKAAAGRRAAARYVHSRARQKQVFPIARVGLIVMGGLYGGRVQPAGRRLQEVYIDEAYVWAHDAARFSWFPCNRPLAAIKQRASRGKRWTLIWAGTRDGWVYGSQFLDTKTAGGFAGTVTASGFEKWFSEQLFPNLHQPSLLILDNASIHKRRLQTLSEMTVPQLRAHLMRSGVAYPPDANKAALLELVANHCAPPTVIEELARAAGHRVLYLPPYHPELNPIERMWGVIKNAMRSSWKDEPYTNEGFLSRMDVAMEKCTPEGWAKDVKKSWRKVERYCDLPLLERETRPLNFQGARASSAAQLESKELVAPALAAATHADPSDTKRTSLGAAGPRAARPPPNSPTPSLPTRVGKRTRGPPFVVLAAALDREEDLDPAPSKPKRAKPG